MGTLYVVATPIGNLEDITLRALRVLREVQLIAAEDTRRTAKLLQHYSIATRTTSLHEHNEGRKTESLLQRLAEGADIALVSDAGTPLVSDPGGHLVAAAREAGYPVVSVPGASAVMAVLSASGLDASEFTFLGFPPRKAADLKRWIERELTTERTAVFFEAPHRVRLTLENMLTILGDRPIIVGRELTKLHEELVIRPISSHLEKLKNPRGEFTLVIKGSKSRSDDLTTPPEDDAMADEIGQLIESAGLSPRAAARQVAAKYGLPVNTAYRLWTEAKR
jgi:16S rRNA (cytidine1402-2'-O)-methyltransferase